MPSAEDEQRLYDWGAAIRYHRKESGLTQDVLAERVGVDRKSISRLENGVTRIRIDFLWRIADALEIRIGDLETRADDIATSRTQQQSRPTANQ